MSFDVSATLDALASHFMGGGYFDVVMSSEPMAAMTRSTTKTCSDPIR